MNIPSSHEKQEKETFYSRFTEYIQSQYEAGKISQEEYKKVIESLEKGEFENVLKASSSIEVINIGIMRYSTTVLVGILLSMFPDKPGYATISAVGIDRIIKGIYSYFIARGLDVPNYLKFAIFNTIPFGKYITPFVWLKDDRTTLLHTISYVKHRVEYRLSHPLLQGVIKTVV